MKMQVKKSNTTRKAWNIIRLTLRRRVTLNLPKYIKSLGHDQSGTTMRYSERQLSFEDAPPIIHIRMHRPSSLRFKLPNIPCINPAHVDLDLDMNDDSVYYDYTARKSFLKSAEDVKEEYSDQETEEQAEDIDTKAEEFIAKFYEQMKLQRQFSYLQYHNTSISAKHAC